VGRGLSWAVPGIRVISGRLLGSTPSRPTNFPVYSTSMPSLDDDPYYRMLKKRRSSRFGWDAFMRLLFSILVFAACGWFACCRGFMVDRSEALRAANDSGYTEAKITSESRVFSSFAGCSRSDAAAFDMVAKNPNGKPVKILVCVGWPFKGSTVRIP